MKYLSELLKRFRILLWKDYILTKRNIWATIFEICVPLLLIFTLSFLSFDSKIDDKFHAENFPDHNFPSDYFKYYFYPNNSFIEGLLARRLPSERIFATNSSDYLNLDPHVLISFPADIEKSLPNHVNYSIFIEIQKEIIKYNEIRKMGVWKRGF